MIAHAVMDRVFIRLKPVEKQTTGGIILTDDFEHRRTIGTVESVGPQVSGVKPGDKVLFHVFDELPTYDSDFVVVRENSILGVITDE